MTELTYFDIAKIVRMKLDNPSYGIITIASYTGSNYSVVRRVLFNHFQSIEALEAITADIEIKEAA